MTRPNITPGPWIQNPKVSRIIHAVAHDPICEVNSMDEIPRQQETANSKAIAAVPALLEALETIHANAAESPEWIRRHTTAALTAALTAAGYQF